MDTILTVKKEDLSRLSPNEAVELFRELLWAEATRVGIPISKVQITTNIYVPDGGVDASVDGTVSIPVPSFLELGLNGFQIKAGESFEPWQESVIKKELFGKKDILKDNLGAATRNILDNSGKYTLVCFKEELTDQQRRDATELLTKHFKQCGYKNPKVDVLDCSHIMGFLKFFPSLSLALNGRAGMRFQFHSSWSNDSEMRKLFFPGDVQNRFIADLRSVLQGTAQSGHARVLGEPGVGKTRLVLEATRTDDLAPITIYCPSASTFRDSDLMYELMKGDREYFAIIVVDECDPDSRSYIWNKLQYRGKIKLISIYHEPDNSGGTTNYFDAPTLGKEHITEIIQSYGVPKDRSSRYADFCSGSPRVAHVFGWNEQHNPDDMLKSPDTVNVWDRFVVGGDDPSSDEVRLRRVVLQHLALFKKFGIGPVLVEEGKAVVDIIRKGYPEITYERFLEIIRPLRDRRLLQGENTLYITPKALHIKLWAEWWDTYAASGFNVEEFSKSLSPVLRSWFFEMFKYAATSKVSSQIVKDLLGPEGPFQRSDYLRDEIGSDFFLALTEADPPSALACLQNTIGKLNRDDLVQFKTGRRKAVWALEKLVLYRELFSGASRLLLALGEAENESWANNASGVFASLFSLGRGLVAPTQATPKDRRPILLEALNSTSKERRLLGLKACAVALEAHHFTRDIGAEYQGLTEVKDLWSPKTWGEVFDAYRDVWSVLVGLLPNMADDEKTEAVSIILQHSRGLASYVNLSEMVIDTFRALATDSQIEKKKILGEVVRILHYDGREIPEPIRGKWEKLKEDLTGNDFPSLLKRYVGMQLMEDQFDLDGNQNDTSKEKILNLARQVTERPALLNPELPWLVTNEADNGFVFGYELGKLDNAFSLLASLVDAQKAAKANQSLYFLGGYFRALFERDTEKWEGELESLSHDELCCTWVPELTWRSGLTDTAALRILKLAKETRIKVAEFKYFVYGGLIRVLPESVFKLWIEFLLGVKDELAISISLDLYSFYYLWKGDEKPLPEEETMQLLTNPSYVQNVDEKIRGQMIDYHWAEIAKGFLKAFPGRSLEISAFMLPYFGQKGSIFESFYSLTQNVLNEIAQKHPKEVWDQVKIYLGPPRDSRAFHITQWLRGESSFGGLTHGGALAFFPAEAIFKWVEEDIDKRAWYLATFVPPSLFRNDKDVCLAREVLIRYGGRDDVQRNLRANFSSEGWTGPESLHYQKKKEFFLELKKEETNEIVKTWMNEYVEMLDHNIARARIEEEREDF